MFESMPKNVFNTTYAAGLDKTKVLQVYRAIPVFLGKDNKIFQITKVAKNARNRDYIGVTDWLKKQGSLR